MNNMLDTITIRALLKLLVADKINLSTAIVADTGWKCPGRAEVDTIYYNSKTNVLMLTRKLGNEYVYEDCDDWELLWKHPKYYTEVDL